MCLAPDCVCVCVCVFSLGGAFNLWILEIPFLSTHSSLRRSLLRCFLADTKKGANLTAASNAALRGFRLSFYTPFRQTVDIDTAYKRNVTND